MRSAIKPEIGWPITGADRDLIVEEIVDNLRPFKRGETFAAERATRRIELLDRISKKPNRRPSELRKGYLKFRNSLTAFIAAFEQLPPSAIHNLVHFAGIYPMKAEPIEKAALEEYSRQLQGTILLQQLRRLAATAAGLTHGSSEGFSPDFSLKRITAHHAYELMHEASKAPITGTAEGPYRNIASKMFKAVSGKFLDSKRWCDAEIKRHDHDEILRSLLVGTNSSHS